MKGVTGKELYVPPCLCIRVYICVHVCVYAFLCEEGGVNGVKERERGRKGGRERETEVERERGKGNKVGERYHAERKETREKWL